MESKALSVYRALHPVPRSQKTKPVCLSGYPAWKVMVIVMTSSSHNAGGGENGYLQTKSWLPSLLIEKV